MLVHKEVLGNIHKYLIKTKKFYYIFPHYLHATSNDNFHHRIYSLD